MPHSGSRNSYRIRWDGRTQVVELHKGSTEGSGYDASMQSAGREKDHLMKTKSVSSFNSANFCDME